MQILFTLVFLMGGLDNSGTQRVLLQLGEEIYPHVSSASLEKNTLVLVLNGSSYGFDPTLVVLDKKGRLQNKYDAKGNGPGHLAAIGRVSLFQSVIYAPEVFKPIIHTYNAELRFIKDYRVEVSGHIVLNNKQYLGIWGEHHRNGKVFMVGLYRKGDFALEHVLFPKEDDVAILGNWGGACFVDENQIAAIFDKPYKVHVHNLSTGKTRGFPKLQPAHIPDYTPWKKSRNIVNATDVDAWTSSWAPIDNFWRYRGHYMIGYKLEGKEYFDIMSDKGHLLLKKQPRGRLLFVNDEGAWLAEKEENEEGINHFLVMQKIHIDG